MSVRFRSVLERFEAYKPGKTVLSPDGRSFKLSSNESPGAPLPSVIEAIGEAALTINRYPDNGCTELIAELSLRHGVPEDHIAVGCGSVVLTQHLFAAVSEPGVEIIFAWRSFEAYPQFADLCGATAVPVPLKDDETHDLDAMLAAITPATRMVIVCNPNNPTGEVVRRDELTAFLDAVPPHVLVVLDEAYREYIRDEDVPDGLTLYGDRPNVCVLRTFSKAYGLAGLRVGFLVGHPAVAQAMRKVYLPFSVNSLAQAAAVASLRHEDELLERVAVIVAERGRVVEELRGQGWTVPDTQANFVWIRLGDRSADFAAHCAAAGVSVRPFATDGVRVSIADPADNDVFLQVAAAYPHRS
ncbi:pyridoxal phosphate-dependent aminotransferase [Actinocorallia longicatena]|uniref:Aromatic amino acid aminotransferase n=1 Tax=Actinocorallia longicatena TaxID=111803 RepID=A0ABP6QKK7_9ACTN